jgi:uncharacterized BrkB/YihY/UPF0761 family membrane protein
MLSLYRGLMATRSGKRELILGTAIALVLTVLLSFGATYGLNRYLGPIDDPMTTGSLLRRPPIN